MSKISISKLWPQPKKSVEWAGWRTLLTATGVFLGSQILLGLMLTPFFINNDDTSEDFFDTLEPFTLMALEIIAALIMLVLLRSTVPALIKKENLGISRLTRSDISNVIKGYGVYIVGALTAIVVIDALIDSFNQEQIQDTGFETTVGGLDLLWVFISLVVVAPIIEEIFFRSFLFRGLIGPLSVWQAAVFSSFIFGLVHLQANVAVDAFILGLALSWLVVKTNKIGPAILLHSVKNLIAFLLLFVFKVN